MIVIANDDCIINRRYFYRVQKPPFNCNQMALISADSINTIGKLHKFFIQL